MPAVPGDQFIIFKSIRLVRDRVEPQLHAFLVRLGQALAQELATDALAAVCAGDQHPR